MTRPKGPRRHLGPAHRHQAIRRFPDLKAAADLLRTLREAGVDVTVRGDYLRIDPPEALQPDIEEQLRIHKAGLMRILQDIHPCASCGRFAFPYPEPTCYWCRCEPVHA